MRPALLCMAIVPLWNARKAGRPVHVTTPGGTSRAPEVGGVGKQVLLALTRPPSPRLATSEPIRARQVAVHSGTGSRFLFLFAGHMYVQYACIFFKENYERA